MITTNPFLTRSTLEYELPPFAQITDEQYLPAFYTGCEEQLKEIAAITAEPTITFENTIVAMERSGQILHRVLNVFFNKSSSDTSPALDVIEAEIAPKLAAHRDTISLNPDLFQRIKTLYETKDSLNLNEEDAWLLHKYHTDFIHAGAHLDAEKRKTLTEINEELSKLDAEFSKRVLADTKDLAVIVDTIEELHGLTDNQIAACQSAAETRGLTGKYLINIVNFTGHPYLASLTNRALREKIMTASLQKGDRGNANDTKELILKTTKLRAQRAQLFGFKNHAEYVTSIQTAKNPQNIHAMLTKIAKSARANAEKEAALLQTKTQEKIESWDWAFYTEQIRKEKYNLDTAAMRDYFELETVLHDGVFFAATKLFGITFKERTDLITYHPEARAFEVFNEDGSKLGIFIGDFYTRDSKRGGAWMNNLVDQNKIFNQLPVVCNNLNIPKPPQGEPTLLTLDECTTLFHEFGHALHGLLSNVTYIRTSGTSTERDFVEFPSQVNEIWIMWPEVLDNYAKHYKTKAKFPQEWREGLQRSETFDQGHATTSYLAAAIIDLAWHEVTADQTITDVTKFEEEALQNYGLDYSPVPTRYRSTYFSHIFAGGYSAGYYGYIWSEVLDADTVEWFKESGGLTRANGDHFRAQLLSRGGSIDTMQMYRNFRGRDAGAKALLERRGL